MDLTNFLHLLEDFSFSVKMSVNLSNHYKKIHFGIFSVLLGIAILLHNVKTTPVLPETAISGIILGLAAGWLILKPTSLFRFCVMVIAFYLYFFHGLPYMLNHCILLAFVFATIPIAIFLKSPKTEPSKNPEQILDAIAPAIRWQVVIVYAWATLHKCNVAFINPEQSAAVAMFNQIPFFPDIIDNEGSIAQLAVWGTLLIEGSIAVLLIFSKTRIFALLIALPFHLVLGMVGHVPFSGFVYPLLFIFLPIGFLNRINEVFKTYSILIVLRKTGKAVGKSPLSFPIFIGVYILVKSPYSFDFIPNALYLTVPALALYFYLAYTFILFFVAFVAYRHRDFVRHEPVSMKLPSAIYSVFIMGLFLNGLSPYLGLKTQTSFSMYSNLNTEAGMWNHLFIPQSLRFFDYQNDLVTIIDTDLTELKEAMRKKERLVHHEFLRLTSRAKKGFVTYRYKGEIIEVANVSNNEELRSGAGLILEKILYFRSVTEPGEVAIPH